MTIRRILLELRRARGWLAYCFICKTPVDPFVFGGIPLDWAMTYGHWDWDRSNWRYRDARELP